MAGGARFVSNSEKKKEEQKKVKISNFVFNRSFRCLKF